MTIERAFKTVWIVEVLSPEKLGAETPLRNVIERVTAGDYAASLIVIEGGTFTGPEEIARALEDLDLKGNYTQDGDLEPEPAEEHDPGEDGDTGIAERENLDEDAEESDPKEDAHLDAPKYPERPGGETWDSLHVCDVCLEARDDRESKPFETGTAYRCDLCELDFIQPVMVRDPEAS